MKLKVLLTACAALGIVSASPVFASNVTHFEMESELVAAADADLEEITAHVDRGSNKARGLYQAVRDLYKAGYRKNGTEVYRVLPLKLIEGYEVQNIMHLAMTFKHKESGAEQVLSLTFRPLLGNVLPREIVEIEKAAKSTSVEAHEVGTLADDLMQTGLRGAQLKELVADLKANGFEARSGTTAGVLPLGETKIPETFDQFCVKTTFVHPESGESRVVALAYKVSGDGDAAKKELRKVTLLKPIVR